MGLKYRINGWVKGILNWRIADAITTWYVNISPAYRRSFWISFIIINVVFCVHTANFLFGNHDFSSLFGDIVWFRMAMEGRFFNTLPYALWGNNLLPVANNVGGFFCMVLGGTIFCRLFHCREKTLCLICGTLLLVLPPYICSVLYYSKMFFSVSWIFALVPMVFLLLERPNIIKLIFASLMVCVCLGIYQSCVAMFGVTALALVMVECVEFRLERPWYKNSVLKRFAAYVIAIIVGCGLYMLVLYYLRKNGILKVDSYNLQTVGLSELPARIWPTFENAVKSMTVGQIYMPAFYKYIMIAVMALGWLSVAMRIWKRPEHCRCISYIMSVLFKLLIIVACGVVMFFLIEFSSFVAKAKIMYTLRVLIYSVPPLLLVGYLLTCRYGAKVVQNIVFCLVIIILWRSVIGDFAFQKNLKLGTDIEFMTYQRILSMIEQDPRMLKRVKSRTLVEIGLPDNFRERFVAPWLSERPSPSIGCDVELFRYSFNPTWSGNTGQPFKFLSDRINYGDSYCVPSGSCSKLYQNFKNNKEIMAFLAQAQSWPAPAEKCLFVNDKYVIVVLHPTSLRKFKDELEKY